MQRALFLLIFLCALVPAHEGPSLPRVVPAKVGLILIGTTENGFAIASDGSSLNADGRVSQEQKLFQLGKNSALALTGTVSIQDPIGARVRGEVNVARIAAAWVAAHESADFATANREVNAAIAAELNKFLASRPPGGANAGAFKFGVVAAGFSAGKPVLITTKYFMPLAKGKHARVEQTRAAPQPGDLWLFGSSAVPEEVLSGKSEAFSTFRGLPGPKEFRAIEKSRLTTHDYVGLFDAILQAAESNQGHKLDARRAIVAAPNSFATLTAESGYISMH